MSERKTRRLVNRHTKADNAQKQIGLQECLRTYEGRRFIWGLLEEFGVFQNSFRPAGAEETAFACGMTNAGQSLLAKVLEADPEAYFKMTRENQERQSELEALLQEAQKEVENDFDSDDE